MNSALENREAIHHQVGIVHLLGYHFVILSQHDLPLARSAQLWKQLEISLLREEEGKGEVEKEVGGIEVRRVMRRGGGCLHCFVRPGRNCRCSWNIKWLLFQVSKVSYF